MSILEELKWRGLVADCTDAAELEKKIASPVTLYCGFDPTAEDVYKRQVVTFPIPNHKDYDTYGPIDTAHLKPHTIYPDSYTPGLPSSGLLDTDTHTGFSGGDVAPWIPGNRFTVFDN